MKNKHQPPIKRKKPKIKRKILKELRILYANPNGIKGKANSLAQYLREENIHIATLAETKLEGNPPKYRWVLMDNKKQKTKEGRGCGHNSKE